jgi:hypothetical protein
VFRRIFKSRDLPTNLRKLFSKPQLLNQLKKPKHQRSLKPQNLKLQPNQLKLLELLKYKYQGLESLGWEKKQILPVSNQLKKQLRSKLKDQVPQVSRNQFNYRLVRE